MEVKRQYCESCGAAFLTGNYCSSCGANLADSEPATTGEVGLAAGELPSLGWRFPDVVRGAYAANGIDPDEA